MVESSSIFRIFPLYSRNRKCLVISCFFDPLPTVSFTIIQGCTVALFKPTFTYWRLGWCLNYFLFPRLVTYLTKGSLCNRQYLSFPYFISRTQVKRLFLKINFEVIFEFSNWHPKIKLFHSLQVTRILLIYVKILN